MTEPLRFSLETYPQGLGESTDPCGALSQIAGNDAVFTKLVSNRHILVDATRYQAALTNLFKGLKGINRLPDSCNTAADTSYCASNNLMGTTRDACIQACTTSTARSF